MRDRISTNTVEVRPGERALRYGIYSETGALLRYEYIRPEDEPLEDGTPIGKETLLNDANALRFGLTDDMATPNNAIGTLADTTPVKAEASHSDGVVTLTSPPNPPKIIFIAPSDFSSSDIFTLNDRELTLMDSNKNPLDAAWLEGAPVELTIVGAVGFFRQGGGGGDLGKMFLIQITFSSDFAGNPFTIAGGDFTRTKTVPQTLRTMVSVPHGNTIYTITSGGYSVTVAVGATFGVYSVSLRSISPIFGDNTWEQIGAAADSDSVPDTWLVGDTKDISLSTGEILTVQIYGKKHDDLTSGGKSGLTLGLKNLMASTRQMNASNTNGGGFTGSAMYTWLTGTLLAQLPDSLQRILKAVNKKTSAGGQSTTINTNSMKIFLLSEVECFGATSNSVPGEGSLYPIFTTATSRIKHLSNGAGAAQEWRLRSPAPTSSISFGAVYTTGISTSTQASTPLGVCFGFCI